MRSRCLGSKLACILNTKPVIFFSSGFTTLTSVALESGVGAKVMKASNNSLTPKLFTALPKNTGDSSPAKYLFTSNLSYTPSINSMSCLICLASRSPNFLSTNPSFKSSICISSSSSNLNLPGVNRFRFFSNKLYTPLKLLPIFMGQLSG